MAGKEASGFACTAVVDVRGLPCAIERATESGTRRLVMLVFI